MWLWPLFPAECRAPPSGGSQCLPASAHHPDRYRGCRGQGTEGLDTAPKLAVGDGALGYWNELNKVYPETGHQRCWVHETANVLDKLPKSVLPKVKSAPHEIYQAEAREGAHKAFDSVLTRFEARYPKAMACLQKDQEDLLAFYEYPAEHWVHLRTTNPIESTFATVWLRTKKSLSCGSRDTALAMVCKLLQSAERKSKGSSSWSWW